MRLFFLLLFLIGAALGVVYPWAAHKYSAHQIGSWRLEQKAADYSPVTANLEAKDAPARVLLDVLAVVPKNFDRERPAFTLTVSANNRTVLAEPVTLAKAEIREDSPQTPEQYYRLPVGTLEQVEAGANIFSVGLGDAEGLEIRSIDLIVEGGEKTPDRRAQPWGFSLLAIGFIGFILSLRRKPGHVNPNGEPPKPRWGRNASER